MADGFEGLFVQLIVQRDGGRDVDFEDLLRGQVVKVHDERTQGVAVCGDEDGLAGFEVRNDDVLEVGNDTGDAGLEGLRRGQFVGRNGLEHLLVLRVALVVVSQCGRSDVEGTSPDLDLVVAVLGGGLSLVEALKDAVMLLVQLPCADDRDVLLVELAENVVRGVDGSLEVRGVADVEFEAFFFQQLTAAFGLFDTVFGQVDIGPAGEQVGLVPLGLAVTDDNEVHKLVFCHEVSLLVRLGTPLRGGIHVHIANSNALQRFMSSPSDMRCCLRTSIWRMTGDGLMWVPPRAGGVRGREDLGDVPVNILQIRAGCFGVDNFHRSYSPRISASIASADRMRPSARSSMPF